jgi:hypothetical protein
MLKTIEPRWQNELAVVAGTGPSLPGTVAELVVQVRQFEVPRPRVVAINDAYRLLPDADLLYACDAIWWDHHRGAESFKGERWSTHDEAHNKKLECAARWKLNLIQGEFGNGFSTRPDVVHYGRNSGFQAINLALLLGATRIVLIGFDMQHGYGRHFFGDHPHGFKQGTDHSAFVRWFDDAAKRLPKNIRIVNANLESGLQCFEKLPLAQAMRI